MSDNDSVDPEVTGLFDMLTPKKNGVQTDPVRLIYSAHVGLNAEIFPAILKLHVKDGARIADVTYGKGAFWKFVPKGRYVTAFSDLNTGKDAEDAKVRRLDCRKLPYESGTFDAVILDPPSVLGTDFIPNTEAPEGANHDAVLKLYEEAGVETARVLRTNGVVIVKCQDEICAHRMRFTHMEIVQSYERLGLEGDDLFVVVATNNPTASKKRQHHSRRSHHYFLVFKKRSSVAV